MSEHLIYHCDLVIPEFIAAAFKLRTETQPEGCGYKPTTIIRSSLPIDRPEKITQNFDSLCRESRYSVA